MKILLTGASGTLSAAVIPVLLKGGHDIVLADVHQGASLRTRPEIRLLDVNDRDSVRSVMEEVKPEYIFHFAAETDVDLCERDPARAFLTNTEGTKNMALACAEYGASLLYISTGAVFSGDKIEPYVESDPPAPVNIYGKSKLEGEIAVRGILKKYFIIRAGWMIGGWELDKKFVYKIIRQLEEGKKELMAVNDKFGSPTFTTDFASRLMGIIGTKKYGVYHLVNNGVCSRFDMAVKIVDFMGLAKEVKVAPIPSDRFPLPAPRGRSEMLFNGMLELLQLNNMPRWERSLEEYIKANRDRQKLHDEKGKHNYSRV